MSVDHAPDQSPEDTPSRPHLPPSTPATSTNAQGDSASSLMESASECKGKPKDTRVKRAAEEGVRDDQWHRVHPITLFLEIWHVIAAIVALVTYRHADEIRRLLRSDFVRGIDLWNLVFYGIGGAGVGLALLIATAYLSWRKTTYAVTDQAVWMRTGILKRRQRHARLERIQSVDISQPLLGRLFGLGQLDVEVAGGTDSNVLIGYLKLGQLEALRAEILARAAGVYSERDEVQGASAVPRESRVGAENPAAEGETAPAGGVRSGGSAVPGIPVAAETPLYEVPIGRLIAGNFLSIHTLLSLLLIVAFFGGGIILFFQAGMERVLEMTGFFAFLPIIAAFVWSRFAGNFHFRAAISADGIRVRRGLTSVSAQTIPPRRVHAVKISQPFFWRFLGWYKVDILQAGMKHGGGESESTSQKYGSHTLLPIGTQQEAELALWMVIADLGVDDPRAFLDVAFHGTREGGEFVPVPARAKIFDPFVYARRAYALTRTAFVTRDGWLTRTVTVAPVTRLQSVEVESGPWERARGLCSVRMHTVDGPVSIAAWHTDATRAQELLRDILIIGERQRVTEPPDRWMSRVLRVQRAEEETAPPSDTPTENSPRGDDSFH